MADKEKKSLLEQAAANTPQDKASDDSDKYVVNPDLRSDSVILHGEDLGGDGENKNRFYVNREYGNVKKEALDQEFNGVPFLVKLN